MDSQFTINLIKIFLAILGRKGRGLRRLRIRMGSIREARISTAEILALGQITYETPSQRKPVPLTASQTRCNVPACLRMPTLDKIRCKWCSGDVDDAKVPMGMSHIFSRGKARNSSTGLAYPGQCREGCVRHYSVDPNLDCSNSRARP